MNYGDADVILVGVSRVGKTPTCLYMALHYGVKAANYPLTEDDLDKLELPKRLVPYQAAPLRPDDRCAAPGPGARGAQARQPLREDRAVPAASSAQADKLFRRESIPVQNTTHTSIEEIASKILAALGIERHMF